MSRFFLRVDYKAGFYPLLVVQLAVEWTTSLVFLLCKLRHVRDDYLSWAVFVPVKAFLVSLKRLLDTAN